MVPPGGRISRRHDLHEELLETDAIKSCINPPECARYLAKVLEESIPEVAIEAGKIMVWLRNVARILANANRPVAWTTPTGFMSFMASGNRKLYV